MSRPVDYRLVVQSWNKERFNRERGRRQLLEQDRNKGHEHFAPPRGSGHEIIVEEFHSAPSIAPGAYKERDRFFEEIEVEVEARFPRKGKTTMPGQLVDKRAIVEIGYAFEEEGEMLIIPQALSKQLIDQLINVSHKMKHNYHSNKGGHSERGGESESDSGSSSSPSEPFVTIDKMSIRSNSRERSESVGHGEALEEIGESKAIRDGPPALVVRHRDEECSDSGDEPGIKAEIRALKAEKNKIKMERELAMERRKAWK